VHLHLDFDLIERTQKESLGRSLPRMHRTSDGALEGFQRRPAFRRSVANVFSSGDETCGRSRRSSTKTVRARNNDTCQGRSARHCVAELSSRVLCSWRKQVLRASPLNMLRCLPRSNSSEFRTIDLHPRTPNCRLLFSVLLRPHFLHAQDSPPAAQLRAHSALSHEYQSVSHDKDNPRSAPWNSRPRYSPGEGRLLNARLVCLLGLEKLLSYSDLDER
jgi:hypothetical protein